MMASAMPQPPPHPGVQVVINSNGGPNGAPRRPTKPLSVDEALQYSPMTSAPVFGLDCILRPDVGHPSSATVPVTHDRQAAGKLIDKLDDETTSGHTSTQLETTHEYIQHLLGKDQGLTKFQFKRPSTRQKASNSRPAAPPGANPSDGRVLGPFAKMVLDSTDVAYRYPTPSTPSLKSRGLPSSSNSLRTPTSNAKASTAHNQRALLSNNVFPSPYNLADERPVKPIISIPSLPTSHQKEYQYIPDHAIPKRRKLNTEDVDKLAAVRLRDQKEEADAALVKLQDLLQEIFEAEDQIQPDTSSEAPQVVSKFFRASSTADEGGLVLSSEIHSHLQKSMQKVTGYGRLHDIPTEYLSRIQKLCEGPILSSQSHDLKLEESSSESDVNHWLKIAEDMHNSLLAVGTLLQTMSGDRNEQSLCPEDLVQAIPRAMNHVFDSCIIPAVEARSNGKDSQLFAVFSANKRVIGGLAHQSKKILALLANFLSRVEVAEGTITATEFLATKLIFAESSHTEKDSALGLQKYEAVRRGAMDVLAKIFSKYPDQRSFILDEILVSLEKLPSTRQSARQFKLIDGKNIQLLSALVMQLVQTTALQTPGVRNRKTQQRLPVPDEEDEDDGDSSDDPLDGMKNGSRNDRTDTKPPLERLASRVEPLYDNAAKSAQYITGFIVQRAMTSTKTGDQPFRNILDIFTEDLISVLPSTDWPAAELLLRVLASQMVSIAEHDKSTSIAKNMALELLGWMGSAISDLTVSAQYLLPVMDESDSDLTEYLRQSYDEHTRRALHPQHLVISDGPYRMVLEYLHKQNLDSWQLTSARGYYLAQWAKTMCTVYNDPNDEGDRNEDAETDDLAKLLEKLLSDPKWLENNIDFDDLSTAHAKFAYYLTVLNMGFCKAFDTILKVLLHSITSDQAKVRSRSLKSVIHMLEKDPNLLDRDPSVMRVILRCAGDSSPMVRDSALSLIGKCMTLKPALEEEGCRTILSCSADGTVGVRKRCIGLLKDVYNRSPPEDLKFAIMEALLQRINDHEEGVAAFARQVFEEVWLSPFHHSIDSINDAPKTKVALGEQVSLIVNSVSRSERVISTLEVFLRSILSNGSKSASSNYRVCKAMVAAMFERVVDGTQTGKVNQQSLMQTITIFAKANANLFSPDQLETLQPYIGHLQTADDLFLFRSVVVIYRCVLPFLSSSHNTLLKDVQNDLFKSVSKLARAELNEVMACLWTINGVLENTERLVKLTISVLKGIDQAKDANLADENKADILARVRSYVRIAGCVGKHCDLEQYRVHFQRAFPLWKVVSVADLMVDFISPFTLPAQPLELRIMALESLGSICQTWPAQFSREIPRKALSSVFDEDNADLQNIVLKAFSDFFAIHEGKSEKLVRASDGAADENGTRLGGSLRANDNDGAAALIAQHFLRNMLRVAQSRQDSYALTAIELVASINRQGLVHPKECAGTLVSLGTSIVPAISKVAFDTHNMLHQQHESMFEREYMRAIQDAFYYQRDIVGDPTGALARPYIPKLSHLFDVIKTSNSRYQKKFLSNLCSRVDFEPRKLDVSGDPPECLLFARFVSQNLAFFEYGQIAELLPTIACIERIVAATGNAILDPIEADILPARTLPANGPIPHTVPPMDGASEAPPLQEPQFKIDLATLKKLTVSASILTLLWEARTYIRRLYGINQHTRPKDAKPNPKELNRAPTKVPGITGDKFWEATTKIMRSLDSTESMIDRCQQFATLLSIDDELKVTTEDDDDQAMLDVGGEGDYASGFPTTSDFRPTKRKSSVSSGGGSGGASKKSRTKGKSGSGKKRVSTELEDNDGRG